MTVVGTRPELIRLSRLLPLLDSAVEHTLVHTGQNYDYELNEIFFSDLGLRRPDIFLNVDRSGLGAQLGDVLRGIDEALDKVRPDAFLVLGDTNSCIAALIARRRKVSVFHMEAGNRCWDINVPEETNRRLVDHVSDINICYTEHARRNLLNEGLHPRSLYVCGSPMNEVLAFFRQRIAASTILTSLDLEPKKYLVASLHREENVENRSRFEKLVKAIAYTATRLGFPVLISVHPRTQRHIDQLPSSLFESFIQSKPLGFHDYNKLQLDSFAVISDSGTISEESSILNFPAVTPRISIERPEALDAGCISLGGESEEQMFNTVQYANMVTQSGRTIPPEYNVEDFSRRVLNLVLSVSPVRDLWSGVQR